MGIQDDIFDVRAALKRKPEAKAFKRLEKYLATLEEESEEQHRELTDLRKGARAFVRLLGLNPDNLQPQSDPRTHAGYVGGPHG